MSPAPRFGRIGEGFAAPAEDGGRIAPRGQASPVAASGRPCRTTGR